MATTRGKEKPTQDHSLGIRENKAHIKKNPNTNPFLLRKTGNNYKIQGHTTAAHVFVVPFHTHRNCSKVFVNCQHQHWGFSLHISQSFRHFWVCLKKFRVFFILVVPKAFLCFHTVFLLPCLQLADPKSFCKCQKQSSKCLKRTVPFILHFAKRGWETDHATCRQADKTIILHISHKTPNFHFCQVQKRYIGTQPCSQDSLGNEQN